MDNCFIKEEPGIAFSPPPYDACDDGQATGANEQSLQLSLLINTFVSSAMPLVKGSFSKSAYSSIVTATRDFWSFLMKNYFETVRNTVPWIFNEDDEVLSLRSNYTVVLTVFVLISMIGSDIGSRTRSTQSVIEKYLQLSTTLDISDRLNNIFVVCQKVMVHPDFSNFLVFSIDEYILAFQTSYTTKAFKSSLLNAKRRIKVSKSKVTHADPESHPKEKLSANYSVAISMEEYTKICEGLYDRGRIGTFQEEPHKQTFLHTLVVLLGSIGCRISDFKGAKITDITDLHLPRKSSDEPDVYLKIQLNYFKGVLAKHILSGYAWLYPDLNNRARCPVTALARALTIIDPEMHIDKDVDFFGVLFASWKKQSKVPRKGSQETYEQLFDEGNKHLKKLSKYWKEIVKYLPEWKGLLKSNTEWKSLRKFVQTTMGARALASDMQVYVNLRAGHVRAKELASHSQSNIHYIGMPPIAHKTVGKIIANRHRNAPGGDPAAELLIDQYRSELEKVVFDNYPPNLISYMSVERLVPFAAYLVLAKFDKMQMLADEKFSFLLDHRLHEMPMPDFCLDYSLAIACGSVTPISYNYRTRQIEKCAVIRVERAEEPLFQTTGASVKRDHIKDEHYSDEVIADEEPLFQTTGASVKCVHINDEQYSDEVIADEEPLFQTTGASVKCVHIKDEHYCDEVNHDDDESSCDDDNFSTHSSPSVPPSPETFLDEAEMCTIMGQKLFNLDKSQYNRDHENIVLAKFVDACKFPSGLAAKSVTLRDNFELGLHNWIQQHGQDQVAMNMWDESDDEVQSILKMGRNLKREDSIAAGFTNIHNRVVDCFDKHKRIANFVNDVHGGNIDSAIKQLEEKSITNISKFRNTSLAKITR